MNLSHFVANYLEKKKIKDIFLVTGGGMMFLTDAISKSKINLIFNHLLLKNLLHQKLQQTSMKFFYRF